MHNLISHSSHDVNHNRDSEYLQYVKNLCTPNDHMSANSAGEIFALFAKIATAEFVSSMFVLGKMFKYFTTIEALIISHVSQSIYTI
jgi:hypothetical protein